MSKDTRTKKGTVRAAAPQCRLVVITESFGQQDGNLPLRTAVAEVFGPRSHQRFDLLGYPAPKYVLKRPEYVDLLVGDLLTAVRLHGADHVLVATSSMPHRRVVRRLKYHPDIRGRDLRIKGVELHGRRPCVFPRTLVITCMDWRLHSYGSLAETVRIGATTAEKPPRTGQRPSIMTVPGAAKDLVTNQIRRDLVLSQLRPLVWRGLSRIILLGHTDCGKYRLTGARLSDDEMWAYLRADIAIARDFLRSHFSGVEVLGRIAAIEDGRVASIS